MNINHHIPDDVMGAYVSGRLPHAFSVIVAAHVSMCDDCRASMEGQEAVGGVLLDMLHAAEMSDGSLDRMLAALDGPAPAAPMRGSSIFPAPVMQALNGQPPRWRMLGGGVRQQILSMDDDGSLRLLYIPAGKAVPEHGHGGMEMTLILQGSFSDVHGTFARGDVEVAYDDVDHQPVAGLGAPCICLAATNAPLRFRGLIPRLLQPLFRI